MYGFLSQFSVRLGPALAPQHVEYLVLAYTWVLVWPEPRTIFSRPEFKWAELVRYRRTFPDTNYVGAYMDDLCARGRGIGPVVKSSSGAHNSPVIVRLYRNDEGVAVLERECRS